MRWRLAWADLDSREQRRRAFLIQLGLIIGMWGCAPAELPETSGPSDGGTIVVALNADIDSWNPYVSNEATSWDVLSLLYPRLVRETGKAEPRFEPWLAESWDFSEDRLRLTFHLRHDAIWSNDQPVTCEDVRFTYSSQIDETLAWDGSYLKERILGVDCSDTHTAVFRFSEAYPDQLLDANDDAIVPSSYGDVPLGEWSSTIWEDRATTCGPFRVVKVTPGQEAVLERDPQWWDAESTHLDQIVFRIYSAGGDTLQRLLDGEVDLVLNVPPLRAAEVARRPDLNLIELPILSYTYLGWNVLAPDAYVADRRARGCSDEDGCSEGIEDIQRLQQESPHPALADPNVRRALTLGIDRQDILDGVRAGYGRIGSSPIVSALSAHTDSSRLAFDPGEAKRLLDRAGWGDSDGNGHRDRAGDELELSVIVNAENQARRDVLERLRVSLERIGVGLNPEPLPRSEFVARARNKAFDGVISGWRAGSRIEPQNLLHTRAAVARGNNLSSWSTAESDGLMDQAAAAPSPEAALPLWHEWQRLFSERQPLTVIYEESRLLGVSNRLHELDPSYLNPLQNVHRCWLTPPAAN